MTHPHLLHAVAAAWSLQAARAALTTRAAIEAAYIAAEQTAHDGVRSTVCGTRGGSGHGDPVGDAAMAAIRPARPNRWALLLADVDRQLVDLAEASGNRDTGVDPLHRLRARIDWHTPATAALLAQALRRLDDVIRRKLGTLGQDERDIGGQCPACRIRGLTAQTSAPSGQWTVVCPDRCPCLGDGCRCGMPVRAAGVPHIWTATHPLVARLLDRQEAA